MTEANDALRLASYLKAEGATLKPIIDVAVAEKLSALRTADYLRERGVGAELSELEALLRDFGTDGSLREGDELEESVGEETRSGHRV